MDDGFKERGPEIMEASPILGRIALSEAALCTSRQSIIPKHFYENSLAATEDVARVSKE